MGEHMDFFRLYLSLEKSSDGFSLGVDGTLLTVVDGKELFWLVEAGVLFPGGGSRPTIRLKGALLTEWRNVANSGFDLNSALVRVEFKPLQPPPHLELVSLRIVADLALPDPDQRGGSTKAKIAGEILLDHTDKKDPKVLVKADIMNANFYVVAQLVWSKLGLKGEIPGRELLEKQVVRKLTLLTCNNEVTVSYPPSGALYQPQDFTIAAESVPESTFSGTVDQCAAECNKMALEANEAADFVESASGRRFLQSTSGRHLQDAAVSNCVGFTRPSELSDYDIGTCSFVESAANSARDEEPVEGETFFLREDGRHYERPVEMTDKTYEKQFSIELDATLFDFDIKMSLRHSYYIDDTSGTEIEKSDFEAEGTLQIPDFKTIVNNAVAIGDFFFQNSPIAMIIKEVSEQLWRIVDGLVEEVMTPLQKMLNAVADTVSKFFVIKSASLAPFKWTEWNKDEEGSEARFSADIILLGDETHLDVGFTKQDLFSAEGKAALAKKLAESALGWLAKHIVRLGKRVLVTLLCPKFNTVLDNKIGRTLTHEVQICDSYIPALQQDEFHPTQPEKVANRANFNYHGPYEQLAFTDTMPGGDRFPDKRNLVSQRIDARQTLNQCKDLCSRGLTEDTSGEAARHGNWNNTNYHAQCYGFTLAFGHNSAAATKVRFVGGHEENMRLPIAKELDTTGTCNTMPCSLDRLNTDCVETDEESRCMCAPGYEMIECTNINCKNKCEKIDNSQYAHISELGEPQDYFDVNYAAWRGGLGLGTCTLFGKSTPMPHHNWDMEAPPQHLWVLDASAIKQNPWDEVESPPPAPGSGYVVDDAADTLRNTGQAGADALSNVGQAGADAVGTGLNTGYRLARSTASNVGSTARSVGSTMSSTASNVGSTVSSTTSDVASTVSSSWTPSMPSVSVGFRRLEDDNATMPTPSSHRMN
eukprot:SAG31_NODE_462_length_15340_cov_2.972968_3_plen_931_part_00